MAEIRPSETAAQKGQGKRKPLGRVRVHHLPEPGGGLRHRQGQTVHPFLKKMIFKGHLFSARASARRVV